MSYLAYCPTGTIFAFGGTTAPNGWLLCQGQAVSRTTFSQLFAAIGSSNGSGDGSTTFNIPDLRGRFLRGLDGSVNRDPDKALRVAMNSGGNTGNALGSVQGMSTSTSAGTQGGTKSTTGLANSNSSIATGSISITDPQHLHSGTIAGTGTPGHYITFQAGTGPNVYLRNNAQNTGTNTTGISASPSGSWTANAQSISSDAETRPINAYVNYIIKV